MIAIEHVLAGLAVIFAIGIAAAVVAHWWGRQQVQKEVRAEKDLRAAVSQKAAVSAMAGDGSKPVTDEDDTLTQSGVIAVNSLLERLIESGDLGTAELWAKNALRSNPDQPSVAARLAEVHYRNGNRREFFDVLSRYVLPQRQKLDAQVWSELERMTKEFSPAKKSVVTELNRAARA
ncbi:MAG: hypothetical protein AAF458_09215 [Pseudomonadota bacterium]